MPAITLSENQHRLYALLSAVPPDFDGARRLLDSGLLSGEDVTRSAICYLDDCEFDIVNARWAAGEDDLTPPYPPDNSVIPGYGSSYVCDVLRLLLPYGLDPNAICTESAQAYNLIYLARYVDNGYQAADAMALLLENGGDPNIRVGGESVYDNLAFDIGMHMSLQHSRARFDADVHTWMVMLGYGAADDTVVKNMHDGQVFDLTRLRRHRNFDFRLSFEKHEVTVHLYDKRTGCEVVNY